MFSLIITIIAIALVAALALATIFYGGQFARDGGSRAITTRTLNEGNQVLSALELYKVDHGSMPTGTSDDIKTALVSGNYLKAWPDVSWELRNDYAVRTGMDSAACLAVNQKLGINSIPTCDDVSYSNRSFCCTTP